jgi:hypothetical protein
MTKKQRQLNMQNKEKMPTQSPERLSTSSMKCITIVVTSVANKVADVKAMRAFW